MSNNFWQGEKVRLRAVEPSDAESFYEWNLDSQMSQTLDYVWFPSSRELVKKWITEDSTKEPKDDNFGFVIETLDGQHAGSINTHTCNSRNGTFSYGLAIREQHQRKGYASEAMVLVFRHFFYELRYQKVFATVYSFNESSIRLHERFGFQKEGQLRRMIYTQGKYHDLLYYGMTDAEFDTLYGKNSAKSSP